MVSICEYSPLIGAGGQDVQPPAQAPAGLQVRERRQLQGAAGQVSGHHPRHARAHQADQVTELQTNLRYDNAMFYNQEEGPYLARAFSWLKGPTSTFTLKTLLRHYAKQALNHGK